MKRSVKYVGIVAAAVLLTAGLGLLLFRDKIWGGDRSGMEAILKESGPVILEADTQYLNNAALVNAYYLSFGYQPLWTDTGTHSGFRMMLFSMLQYADSLGLNPKDYHSTLLQKYDERSRSIDFDITAFKSEHEIMFTDAALSFLWHVAYGKNVALQYDGAPKFMDSALVLNAFHELILSRDWQKAIARLEPRHPVYRKIKSCYQELLCGGSGKKITGSPDSANLAAVQKRLWCFGLSPDSVASITATSGLPGSLKSFQRMVGLPETGALDKATIAALNQNPGDYLALLSESLNFWRWLQRIKGADFLLVNIPAAEVYLVHKDSGYILEMNAILGKPETRTPRFTASMNQVIAYPYWNVPYSIATKEMLPKIKRNTGYLEANNLQVIGGSGEVLDPAKIRWRKFSRTYFPYRLRQSTGCDNSLGVLKFDINAPFSVYLHDTNARSLLRNKNRFLSHGCIRLEKPFILAHHVLGVGFDSSLVRKLNQCIKEEKPEVIPLKKALPVAVLYLRANVGAAGQLRFYPNIYQLP